MIMLCEARPVLEQGHRIRVGPAATSSGGEPVGLGEDPVPDGRPVHAAQRGLDPELGCPSYRCRDLGGLDQHLAGDAAPVNAGTGEGARFDQRHRPLGAVLRHHHVARPRTDNDEREVRHLPILRLRPGGIELAEVG
jgi:hypothetical protein